MFPVLITLFALAFITYTWTMRGFFSAMLNMVCILIAGAIAFGLWEPVSYFLLQKGAGNIIGDSAWGLGLALPFGIVALILRLTSDKLVPANARTGTSMDYAGGALCGLVAAVISTGIMVISLQYLRMPLKSWATYPALGYTTQGTARGSLERTHAMLRPYVDEITAKLYSNLSLTTFSTSTPMAHLQPNVELISTGMRLNYGESGLGQSRNTVSPDDFQFVKSYTVGDVSGSAVGPGGITEDDRQPGIPQRYVDVDGNPVQSGYIAGYVVDFKAGAKEKSGQIVIGNGQVSLVVRGPNGQDWKTLFPIAAISQANSASAQLGRWRYDADSSFYASVGGASQATFAFEFLVPAGYTPEYFYVKNVRTNVAGEPDQKYERVSDRDRAIHTQAIVRAPASKTQQGPIDTSEAVVVNTTANAGPRAEQPFAVSNAIGTTLQKGNEGSLSVEEHARSNWIVDGEHLFASADANTRITESALRIDSLAVTEDTVVLKINVSDGMPAALTGRAAATADPTMPPMILDNLGQRIQAVGFIYKDNQRFHIRYTPGSPMAAINEAPALSASRPDQRMELIFRGNFGTTVEAFLIGNKEIVRFDPPIALDRRQGG